MPRALFGLTDIKTWLLDRGLEWTNSDQGLSETRGQRSALLS